MPGQPDPQNSKQFYFINKSKKSTCLSRSLPAESAAVQRHVQTGRTRSRNPKPVQNEDDQRLVPGQPTELVSRPVGRDADTTGAARLHTDLDRARNAWGDSHASPTYQTILCKQDPFNVTSVPINKRVAGLLHYYMYYYHPSQWPNEMAVLRQGIYIFQEAVLNVMRTAVADRLTMFCLLSAASCRLQFIDRIPSALVAGTEKHYIHEALRLMAAYITNHSLQDATQLKQFLICVIFLNSAEAYRGDMFAAETHLKAATSVMDPFGGLKAVPDESLRGQLAMADLFLACVKLRPCLFDCSYDPGSASTLDLSDHELGGQYALTTAHSLLNRTDDLISSELRAIIQDLVESHSVKSRLLTSSMLPKRAMQVTHWITLRNMAIRHRLLALATSDPKVHVLRVAIIMWTLLAMNVTGRAKTVKVMAPILERLICDIQPPAWNGCEAVKLWAVLVGLHCAADGSDSSTFFMNEICASNSLRSLSNPTEACVSRLAEQLESFQQKFFFDRSIQEVQCRAFSKTLYTALQRLQNRDMSR